MEKCQLGQIGTQPTSRDLLLILGLPVSGTADARYFKFGAQIDHMEYYGENAKLGQIGTHSGSRDLLLNFGTSSVFLE